MVNLSDIPKQVELIYDTAEWGCVITLCGCMMCPTPNMHCEDCIGDIPIEKLTDIDPELNMGNLEDTLKIYVVLVQ